MSFSIYFVLAAAIFFVVISYTLRPRRIITKAEALPNFAAPTKPARAVVLFSKSGPYTLVNDWPRPSISPKELLIRNKAIGLNPVDWKCVAYGFGVHSIPWISGREAAGTVEEVGSEVQGFHKGDRVWVASTNYRDNRTSTFQEYLVAAPFNVGRLPDWVSFEEGGTLGVGCVAAAAALYDGLAVPWPTTASQNTSEEPPESLEDHRPWILIWGASCVTGMMAIQLARYSGLRVFAVAGLQNAPELYRLGADQVLDRHKPDETIAEARKLPISLGIDCVGQETATCAVQALQPEGRLAYLVKQPDTHVTDERKVTATDILIKRFHEDENYGRALVNFITRALFTRALRPARHEVVKGEINGLEEGLKKLQSQEVSGRKLVVTFE